MSTITFAGNLAAEPEMHVTTGGKTVVRCSVMENRRRRTEDGQGWEDAEPNVHRVQVWGGPAEHLVESCGKGDRVLVTGQMLTDRWTDKESGEERTRPHVRADEIGLSMRFHGARATKSTASSGTDEPAEATE